jgi:hypothetical protein
MTRRSQNSLALRHVRNAQAPNRNPQAHAHKLVAKTAADMAGEIYGKVMQSNVAYTEWKMLNMDVTDVKELETRFIALMTPKLLGEARATLAKLLRMPIAESLKEQIHEALVLDNTLRRGRVGMPTLAQDGNYEPTARR